MHKVRDNLITIFLLIFIISSYGISLYVLYSNSHYMDLEVIVKSVVKFWHQGNIYDYIYLNHHINLKDVMNVSTAKLPKGLNLNPPAFNLLVLPLSLLKGIYPYLVWQIASLSAFFYGFKLIYHHKIKAHLNLKLSMLFLLVLSFLPAYRTIILGQVSFLLLPFLVWAWLLKDQKQGVYSAILLGVLFSFKLFFGLFICYFLLNKEFKASIYFCITFLFMGLLATLVLGNGVYYNYYEALVNIRWYSFVMNGSLVGYFSRVFGGYYIGKQLPHHSLFHLAFLSKYLYYFFSVVVLGGMWKIIDFNLSKEKKREFSFCYTLIAMLLISPLAWTYYFIFLFIPAVVVYVNRPAQSIITFVLLIIFILLGGFGYLYPSIYSSWFNYLFWYSSGTYALIALLIGVLISAYQHQTNDKIVFGHVLHEKKYLIIALLPSWIGICYTTAFYIVKLS